MPTDRQNDRPIERQTDKPTGPPLDPQGPYLADPSGIALSAHQHVESVGCTSAEVSTRSRIVARPDVLRAHSQNANNVGSGWTQAKRRQCRNDIRSGPEGNGSAAVRKHVEMLHPQRSWQWRDRRKIDCCLLSFMRNLGSEIDAGINRPTIAGFLPRCSTEKHKVLCNSCM